MKAFCIVACATLAGLGVAAAQPYPSRPVTMVVPFGAGGPTDILARIVGDRMRVSLGQQIVQRSTVRTPLRAMMVCVVVVATSACENRRSTPAIDSAVPLRPATVGRHTACGHNTGRASRCDRFGSRRTRSKYADSASAYW